MFLQAFYQAIVRAIYGEPRAKSEKADKDACDGLNLFRIDRGADADFSVAELDRGFKVLFVSVRRAVDALPMDKRTWSPLLSTLLQTAVAENMPDASIDRTDQMFIEGTGMWGEVVVTDQMCSSIFNLCTKLIDDPRVLMHCTVTKDAVSRVLSQVASSKHERTEESNDLGILCCLNGVGPLIRVFRVQIQVCGYISWWRGKKLIVTVEYHSCSFKPRTTVIQEMLPTIIDQAVSEANGLLQV